MKYLAAYTLMLLSLSACIDDVENVEEQFPQQWQLIRMSGTYNEGWKTGAELDYQEFYLLNPDSTFLKSRLQDGLRISAYGTFSIRDIDDDTYFVFSYSEENEITGLCGSSLTEEALILNGSYITESAPACESPILTYFRVK